MLDGGPAQATTDFYWVLSGVTYPSAGCNYDSGGHPLLSYGSASSGSCSVATATLTAAWSACGTTQPTTVDVSGGYFDSGPFDIVTSGSAAWSAACTSIASATTRIHLRRGFLRNDHLYCVWLYESMIPAFRLSGAWPSSTSASV